MKHVWIHFMAILLIHVCMSEGNEESRPSSCKSLQKCLNKNGKCIPHGEKCNGKLYKGKKWCKSKTCRCCVPKNCSRGTRQPCEALNGTCMSQDAVCDGREVTDKTFCKSHGTCKCCFPETPCKTPPTVPPTEPPNPCNDFCPPPGIAIGSECFYIHGNQSNMIVLSWHDAKAQCEAQGMYLAEPEALLDLEKYIMDRPDEYPGLSNYWLGAQGSIYGTMKWLSDNSTVYPDNPEYWEFGSPGFSFEGVCLIFRVTVDGPLVQYSCDDVHRYICEKDLSVGFFTIGNECFKAFGDTRLERADYEQKCAAEGMEMAIPNDPVAVAKYVNAYIALPDYPSFWLGGHGTNSSLIWNNGSVISPYLPFWANVYPNWEYMDNYYIGLTAGDTRVEKPIASIFSHPVHKYYALCEVSTSTGQPILPPPSKECPEEFLGTAAECYKVFPDVPLSTPAWDKAMDFCENQGLNLPHWTSPYTPLWYGGSPADDSSTGYYTIICVYFGIV